MTLRGVFLADGSSDLPLARHLELMCARRGLDVSLTPVDPALLPRSRTAVARLRYIAAAVGEPDIVFVHRDAESADPGARRLEVLDAAASAGISCPVVPVVPVRMTEAWLLLDEAEIRRVAGRPNGRTALVLPSPQEVERRADPKRLLADALLGAAEVSGRRRRQFDRDFARHRALLLERLDPSGPVSSLGLGDNSTSISPTR